MVNKLKIYVVPCIISVLYCSHHCACRSVVKQLRSKQMVTPEMFDLATIMFSDLPIFSEVTSKCGPLKIIQFLNTVYSLFDEAILAFDVYKVETVNDSYIVSIYANAVVHYLLLP